MSVSSILYTLLVRPLQLLFEVIYVVAEKATGNPGLAIVILSLVVNTLVLPLYLRADAMQKEERDIEEKLREKVTHIKKTFHGNERIMMLQTYYRQNNYKPAYALRGAVSLFLQIPFFLAAYNFLSGLQSLKGVSFGPVADLGEPDGMLFAGSLDLNILPVIMTVVNLVSCLVFTKNSTLKSRIQLYAMAVLFYLILFDSPSGLVFYWTLNNVFSLVKTIVTSSRIYKNRKKIHVTKPAGTADARVFFSGAVFLALLTGLLIPSTVIAASPQEFVVINYFYDPLELVVDSVCVAAGVFVVWLGVYYWLAKPRVRIQFERAVWIFSGVMLINYMFFGKHLGILSAGLKYEKGLRFDRGELFGNAVIILAAAAVLLVLILRWKKYLFQMLLAGCMVLCIMSAVNVNTINASIGRLNKQSLDEKSQDMFEDLHKESCFTLSKTGKNVIVLMLDRAMGQYIPYLFHEKPELKEKFSGFTYYSNVVSYGRTTNFGSPAVFGGYEYTPEEMNKRSSEPLVKKHNEAIKLMPDLFNRNDYEVTVCDPPYANYQWISDLSVYDEYPEIKTYNTKVEMSSDLSGKITLVKNNRRNFFCYSIMKSMPLLVQKLCYDDGNYLQADRGVTSGTGTIKPDDNTFLENYYVMQNLSTLTDVTAENRNTFLMMANDITHCPVILKEPEYTLEENADNTEYDRKHKDRFNLNGQTLDMGNEKQIAHYHVNMAAMIQLAKWFDYLRENGVYDNTRIILASDHGCDLMHTPDMMFDDVIDLTSFYPLLMVKDFDSRGFKTSEEFMTNGDVPTLAMDGLIQNPVNPFTGKKINSDAKNAGGQHIFYSLDWDITLNDGNTFHPGTWFLVHDDMRDKNNWEKVAENAVLPDGK